MTNFEKYAVRIQQTINLKKSAIDCTVASLRGADGKDCGDMNCAKCALENIAWLQQEYSEDCTDCKWYRKIKGESKYYACLKEGQVLSAGDEDIDCGFWEEKK